MAIFIDPILDRIEAMQDVGYSGKEICEFFALTSDELRKMISRRNADNRLYLRAMAKTLQNEGKTYEEIANELGKKESSISILLNDGEPISLHETDKPVKRRIGFM